MSNVTCKYKDIIGTEPKLSKNVYRSNVAHFTIAKRQQDKTFKMFKKHQNNSEIYHNLCIRSNYHEDIIFKQIDNNRILSKEEKKEIFDKCVRHRDMYRKSLK